MIKLTIITSTTVYFWTILVMEISQIPGLANFWQYGALGGMVVVLTVFVVGVFRFANKRLKIADKRQEVMDQMVITFTETVNRFVENETKQTIHMEKHGKIMEKLMDKIDSLK